MGKEFLENQLKENSYGKVFHYEVSDKRIPRQGATVICGDEPAGSILSGGYSPTIKTPIGTAYIEKIFKIYRFSRMVL